MRLQAARRIRALVSGSWRALIARMAPGACAGTRLTPGVASRRGSCIVSASFETPLLGDAPVQAIVADSRERLRAGRSVEELIDAARARNAIVGAHIVSGPSGENHYLLALIPRG